MEGIRVGLVHGKITPARRDEAVEKFRNGEVWVLVVTEVLARGMDFRGVKVVVNYGKSPSAEQCERSEPARMESDTKLKSCVSLRVNEESRVVGCDERVSCEIGGT
jgi:ATP-dependent helicase YprA (DUF1998 family)